MNYRSQTASFDDTYLPGRRSDFMSSDRNRSHSGRRMNAVYASEEDDGIDNEQEYSSSRHSALSSRMSQAHRSHTKKKADRRFARQYGDTDRASGSSSHAQSAQPRAAVYKTKMGSNHKKAARMQNAESYRAQARSSQASPGGASLQSRHRFLKRWQLVSLIVVAFVVVSCVALYSPAQQYYQEIRERDRLQAEYAAVQEQNESIQNQIDALSTDEGIADKAREDLGWVSPGETLGSVSGLDVDGYPDFVTTILPGSVEAPDTWYSSILDPFFGVE